MAKKIQINKTVYNKEGYDKVVDRSFKTFGLQDQTEDEITVAEFFDAYEELYFEIPVQGENESHEYLIKRSSELITFEKDTEDIQPLLDEIADLRQQILEQNEEILELRQAQAERGGI